MRASNAASFMPCPVINVVLSAATSVIVARFDCDQSCDQSSFPSADHTASPRFPAAATHEPFGATAKLLIRSARCGAKAQFVNRDGSPGKANRRVTLPAASSR